MYSNNLVFVPSFTFWAQLFQRWWYCKKTRAVASLGRRGGGQPRVTPCHPDLKLIFLWLNLERTLDERREKMGVARRRQLKRWSLSEAMTKKERERKIGWHVPISCRTGYVTPTLVTPLLSYLVFSLSAWHPWARIFSGPQKVSFFSFFQSSPSTHTLKLLN